MQLCLTLEHRFLQTPDGKIWTVTQCSYQFFKPYLEVFSSVRVIARAFPVAKSEPDFLDVEGPGVEFYAMPAYRGPYEFATHFLAARRRANAAVPHDSAVILRVPGQVANSMEYALFHRKHAYSLEVVADPYDVFSPKSNSHLLAPLARRIFTRALQRQCRHADAVCYVTRDYLQQRYPPAETAKAPKRAQYIVGLSDISLEPDCFAAAPRSRPHHPGSLRAVFVGTLESLYKGPDLLVRAISHCKLSGEYVSARIIGIGRMTNHLQELCRELNVEDRVTFVGAVQVGSAIRQELADADIFVLPSRAEGVPRAMLEAMAQALPCLGSDAGGIPELLSPEDLTPVNDAAALALNIQSLAKSPERFARSSVRALTKAHAYAASRLLPKRSEFYSIVQELAEGHLHVGVQSIPTRQPA